MKVPAIRLALFKLKEHRKRIGQITIAHAMLWTLDFVFDHILYPIALVYFGTLVGGAIMTLLAGFICFCLVIYYERSGIDWLGVNVIEEVKEHGGKWVDRFYSNKGRCWLVVKIIAWLPSRILLLVLFLLKKNDFIAFLTLSVYEDAFKTTVFLRHGRFDGLQARDWFVFFASLVVSNLYWIVRWSVIIEVIKYMF